MQKNSLSWSLIALGTRLRQAFKPFPPILRFMKPHTESHKSRENLTPRHISGEQYSIRYNQHSSLYSGVFLTRAQTITFIVYWSWHRTPPQSSRRNFLLNVSVRGVPTRMYGYRTTRSMCMYSNATDFRRLRKHVARRKKTYMDAYRDIRRKVFAHTEIADSSTIDELFRRTTIDELKEIFVFMSKLYQALWQMYHNGVKPILKQQPHSVKKLLTKKPKPWEPKTIQELIVRDTQFLLREMIEHKGSSNY